MKALSTSAVKKFSSSSPGDRASDGSCLLPEVAHAATDHQIPRRVVLVLVLVLVLSELVTTRHAPVGRTVTVRTEADASRVIYVSDGSRMPVQHLPGEIGRLGLWIARDISVHPTGQGEIVRCPLRPHHKARVWKGRSVSASRVGRRGPCHRTRLDD
jgi:hypothetical protein